MFSKFCTLKNNYYATVIWLFRTILLQCPNNLHKKTIFVYCIVQFNISINGTLVMVSITKWGDCLWKMTMTVVLKKRKNQSVFFCCCCFFRPSVLELVEQELSLPLMWPWVSWREIYWYVPQESNWECLLCVILNIHHCS